MPELSLFVDESGDFGPYKPTTPFYIVLHRSPISPVVWN